MSAKRLVTLLGTLLTATLFVLGRVYLTASNSDYAQSAAKQSATVLTIPQARGHILDRGGQLLTDRQSCYYALCVPGDSSYSRLYDCTDAQTQAVLYQKRNSVQPFLVQTLTKPTDEGIDVWRQSRRTLPTPAAVHLLGYLDGEGHGVTGLEKAYDDLLYAAGSGEEVLCVTTAAGTLQEGHMPAAVQTSGNGIALRLTLDLALQRLCEGTADTLMPKGCILVLDCKTGQVLASVSRPEFDPENVAQSIDAQDTSLINRAFAAYNLGSVFKPVVAAAAMMAGWDWYTWDCEGSTQVADRIVRCAAGSVHGECNMRQALAESCNCYFLQLGVKLGGTRVLQAAKAFGFGRAVAIGGGLNSGAGTLPTEKTLENVGQLAGFSFGQGQLTATPLQVAAMMNTIARGGTYIMPGCLLQTEDAAGETVQNLYEPQSERAVPEDVATALQSMLVTVVEDGIGNEAKPLAGGAGGKTGTAQTGRYDESGREYMNYWFAGFYPAQNPQFTIVVLQDDAAEKPAVSCAQVFARVCDGLYYGGYAKIPEQKRDAT